MAGSMEVGKGEAAKLWRGEKRYENRRREMESVWGNRTANKMKRLKLSTIKLSDKASNQSCHSLLRILVDAWRPS